MRWTQRVQIATKSRQACVRCRQHTKIGRNERQTSPDILSVVGSSTKVCIGTPTGKRKLHPCVSSHILYFDSPSSSVLFLCFHSPSQLLRHQKKLHYHLSAFLKSLQWNFTSARLWAGWADATLKDNELHLVSLPSTTSSCQSGCVKLRPSHATTVVFHAMEF